MPKLCVACNGEVVHGEFVHDEGCLRERLVNTRECISCGVSFMPSTSVQVFCGLGDCMEEFLNKQ